MVVDLLSNPWRAVHHTMFCVINSLDVRRSSQVSFAFGKVDARRLVLTAVHNIGTGHLQNEHLVQFFSLWLEFHEVSRSDVPGPFSEPLVPHHQRCQMTSVHLDGSMQVFELPNHGVGGSLQVLVGDGGTVTGRSVVSVSGGIHADSTLESLLRVKRRVVASFTCNVEPIVERSNLSGKGLLLITSTASLHTGSRVLRRITLLTLAWRKEVETSKSSAWKLTESMTVTTNCGLALLVSMRTTVLRMFRLKSQPMSGTSLVVGLLIAQKL